VNEENKGTRFSFGFERAEAHVDIELERLLEQHDLDDVVERLQVVVTTTDGSQAVR